jgi:hypothetical protein
MRGRITKNVFITFGHDHPAFPPSPISSPSNSNVNDDFSVYSPPRQFPSCCTEYTSHYQLPLFFDNHYPMVLQAHFSVRSAAATLGLGLDNCRSYYIRFIWGFNAVFEVDFLSHTHTYLLVQNCIGTSAGLGY